MYFQLLKIPMLTNLESIISQALGFQCSHVLGSGVWGLGRDPHPKGYVQRGAGPTSRSLHTEDTSPECPSGPL